VGFLSVDAAGLHRELDAGAGQILRIADKFPLKLSESSFYGGEHHVFHRELHHSVSRIKIPDRRLSSNALPCHVSSSSLAPGRRGHLSGPRRRRLKRMAVSPLATNHI